MIDAEKIAKRIGTSPEAVNLIVERLKEEESSDLTDEQKS